MIYGKNFFVSRPLVCGTRVATFVERCTFSVLFKYVLILHTFNLVILLIIFFICCMNDIEWNASLHVCILHQLTILYRSSFLQCFLLLFLLNCVIWPRNRTINRWLTLTHIRNRLRIQCSIILFDKLCVVWCPHWFMKQILLII